MRIAYCTNVRLPSERAHGHQIARVCDALAILGNEVHIFAPTRRNPLGNDYWSFHKANRAVKLTHLGKLDPINTLLPKFLQLFLLNVMLKRALRKTLHTQKFALLYTRSPALLSTLLQENIPVILELHSLPKRGMKRFVSHCNRCKLVLCLTNPMREELLSAGATPENVIVEPDAYDFSAYSGGPKNISPLRFSASADPAIGYAGQLASMGLPKGIPELLGALELLRKDGRNVQLLVAGPKPSNAAFLTDLQHREGVTYCGYLPQNGVPEFLAACTVLIYPAPASNHPFFQRDTSPLKIFEYMAARKPIVAADLPPLRDILNDDNAYLCTPGDPHSLAMAIGRVFDRPEEAQIKVMRAWEKVQEHTWEKRMGRIMKRIEQSKSS